MTKEIAEFAFDLHTGLSSYEVPEFDDLKLIGMAATLSIHIKGLGEIPYFFSGTTVRGDMPIVVLQVMWKRRCSMAYSSL